MTLEKAIKRMKQKKVTGHDRTTAETAKGREK